MATQARINLDQEVTTFLWVICFGTYQLSKWNSLMV